MERYDVLVVGGGPAGCALALTLSHYTSRKVAIVELAGYDRVRVGETLQPGVEPLFRYLGVWEAFCAAKHQPSHSTRSAWGSSALLDRSFFMTPHGHGWHLDRQRFDAMLAGEAARAGAAVYVPARLRALARAADGWCGFIARGSEQFEFSAAFIVDTTGRKASVATSLGARHRTDDDLVGVYCFGLDEGSDHKDRSTLIESAEDGWWYTAFLPDRRVVTALMTDADIMKEKQLLRIPRWIEMLRRTRHTREILLDCQANPRLRAYRAQSRILTPPAGDRWLATGDASASYDPLSSMGITNALSTGIHAARSIDAALNGDRSMLDDYARAIEFHYNSYRALQRRFYMMERRWPESKFWQRRGSELGESTSHAG